MRQLKVFLNDFEVGMLTERLSGKEYTFHYNEQYLDSTNPPVSITLPKRRMTYFSRGLFSFFSNMLPEGANRRIICRSLKIDEKDLFGLLTAMADKDFIGAVNVRSIK